MHLSFGMLNHMFEQCQHIPILSDFELMTFLKMMNVPDRDFNAQTPKKLLSLSQLHINFEMSGNCKFLSKNRPVPCVLSIKPGVFNQCSLCQNSTKNMPVSIV